MGSQNYQSYTYHSNVNFPVSVVHISNYMVSFSLPRIDEKMCLSQQMYSLDEAQEILHRIRNIKKSLSSGEREKQDLMQVIWILIELFISSYFITIFTFSFLP